MKEESNLIDTKENIVKKFTKEQMDIYNYYKKQFENSDNAIYPIAQEDK